MIRRRWFWAVLVLCAAALFVLFRVQRVGEDALRAEAERRLAETLQIDVHLGPLTLGLGEDLPWVDLEFQGVRLQWPEVTLEAQQVGVSVEPIALALGRLSMHGLHIDGLDVEWQDASTPAAGPSDPDEILARAREVGDWLSAHPCFLPDTTVRDAVVAQRHADERREWLIQVSGEYDCMTIRGRAEASLEGQLPGIPKTLKFGLDTRQDHFELTLNFPTLPLSQLAALVGTEKKLEGSLAGRLRVREKGEQALILDVEASGDALSGWLRGAGAAANSDRDIPELRAELQLEPDALRVLNAELNEGEKTYTVDAHLQGLQALPPNPSPPGLHLQGPGVPGSAIAVFRPRSYYA